MNSKTARNSLLLVLTALIWGASFVAQSAGMEYIGPFTFNAIRTIIGGMVLLPVIFITDRRRKKEGGDAPAPAQDKKKSVFVGGILCGVVLFAASSFQQIGIMSTTTGKSGFITALYIIIVPILGLLFKKKVPFTVWIAAGLAVLGMYMLCISEGLGFGKGELLTLVCAFLFSIHILIIDAYSPYVDGVRMSCIQFFVAGLISIPCTLLDKVIDPAYISVTFTTVLSAWLPILYSGLMSCGIGYTLQIIGQKNVPPALASLILSLESVFAALAGWVLLGQTLTAKELIGCAIVFAAIILAQIPLPQRKDSGSNAAQQNINEENEVKDNG